MCFSSRKNKEKKKGCVTELPLACIESEQILFGVAPVHKTSGLQNALQYP